MKQFYKLRNRIVFLFFFSIISILVVKTAWAEIVRVNAGGGNYTDGNGNLWSADYGYNTGSTYSTTDPIAGTTDDVLYQSERWDSSTSPELMYSFPVTNGNYIVNLYFAEIYFTSVGKRVFDINIEGQLVQNDLDIYSEVGYETALKKSYNVTVADGVLNIQFIHQIENPKISAIEILPQVSNTIRVNAGGGNYTDGNGNLWSADYGYNTGSTYSTTDPIAGTTDDVLYQSERWDSSTSPELMYSFPVTNGNYIVNLYFAEIYFTSVGKRVFDINIEGQLVQNDLDIYSEVGYETALKKSYNVTVADGVLNIQFLHQIENPKISAIEILPQGNDTDPPSVPAGLVGTPVSSGQVDLTWNASTDTGGSGLAGYRIYRNGAEVGTTSAYQLFRHRSISGHHVCLHGKRL